MLQRLASQSKVFAVVVGLAAWALVATTLDTRTASAQDILAGGSATFLTTDGATAKVGDAFGEVSWDLALSNENFVQLSALGGFGGKGQGFLGIGGRHYWKASDGFYPALGAQVFYLNADELLSETSIFLGPELSIELLSDAYPWSVRPFVAWYPAISGPDDTSLFRFGIAVNDIGEAAE